MLAGVTFAALGSLLYVIFSFGGIMGRHSTQLGLQPTLRNKLVPIFYDIMACPDKRHDIIVQNVTVKLDDRGGNVVDAAVMFTKGLKTISKLIIVLQRCTGGKGPTLCEHYLRWVWTTALCTFIPAKGLVWTPFVETVTPTLVCPMQKGLYEVHNATLDVEVMASMLRDIHKHIWPVEIHLYDEDNELNFCLLGTVEARFSRPKRNPVHT